MTLAALLHDKIQAVCPIVGVSLVDEDDKSTWSIDFAKEATANQRKAAAQALADFDPVLEIDSIIIKNAAAAALVKTDITVVRCSENDVPVPVAWKEYRVALRNIVSGESTPEALPVQPTYPAGT